MSDPQQAGVIRNLLLRVDRLERKPQVKGTAGGGGAITVSEGPDIDLVVAGVNIQVGGGRDTVLLVDSSGLPVAEFLATDAGLTAALAAATAGDTVLLHDATITGNHSVPAGVTLAGFDRRHSILTGALTGGDEAIVANLSILLAANDGSDLVAVAGPVSQTETLRLYDCVIEATQAGAGNCYALDVNGLGTIFSWGCEISGQAAGVGSVGGQGYAVRAETGVAILYHGRAVGSRDRFLV